MKRSSSPYLFMSLLPTKLIRFRASLPSNEQLAYLDETSPIWK